MRYYESIFKPGRYTRSGVEYVGTNTLDPVPLSLEIADHFMKASALLWSTYPEMQYAMALGQWKQRRRAAHEAGRPTPNTPMPRREDFADGEIYVPPPSAIPRGIPRMKEAGIVDHTKKEEPKVDYEVVQSEYSPPVATPRDGHAEDLKARYLSKNYRSYETFAKFIGEDPAYIREIASRDNWAGAKAAQSRGD